MWHDPGVPLAFPVGVPPLEMRRERREYFPDHTGRIIPPLELAGGNWAPLDVGGTFRASSRVGTSMSGNFLSCSKGEKDPLEVPDVRFH